MLLCVYYLMQQQKSIYVRGRVGAQQIIEANLLYRKKSDKSIMAYEVTFLVYFF